MVEYKLHFLIYQPWEPRFLFLRFSVFRFQLRGPCQFKCGKQSFFQLLFTLLTKHSFKLFSISPVTKGIPQLNLWCRFRCWHLPKLTWDRLGNRDAMAIALREFLFVILLSQEAIQAGRVPNIISNQGIKNVHPLRDGGHEILICLRMCSLQQPIYRHSWSVKSEPMHVSIT